MKAADILKRCKISYGLYKNDLEQLSEIFHCKYFKI